MQRLVCIFAFGLLWLAATGLIAQDDTPKSGTVIGELKTQKNTPDGKNTIIEVLAPGEEKARAYHVLYDAKIKGPIEAVLKSVRAAKVGDRVELEWVQTGHGPAIKEFRVLKKTSADQDARPDQDAIQGTWDVVTATSGGKSMAADFITDMQFVFTKDTLLLKKKGAGDQPILGMHYALNAAKNPREIDTSHELDAGKPIVQLGIYSLEGDTLKLCLEAASRPRPKTLESKQAETTYLFVLKRVKK